MGFLDDLIGDALGNICEALCPDHVMGSKDKRLDRLMAEGELLTARIYGIKYVSGGDSTDEWYYGLDLQTTGGPLRVTVRQQILHRPELAALGATVMVRHAGGQVAIDWPATLERLGTPNPEARSYRTKQLRHPIAPGVEDHSINSKRLERGERMQARIEAVEEKMIFGMPSDAVRLAITLLAPGGERRTELGHVRVPAYVKQAVVPGALIDVAVDPTKPDRITIDWATMAERLAA